ncbi:hypothetical protein OF829_14760 [Sphingomonas sp. LB-2]|uniref:hypothetical protein n=1 Tax=Sphingomonas caeni TaxID=2984949 RepID=UPI002232264C|nr:hypothetical protein [Sphingomonas caeni]MCW3848500.1 hypothetical protein [Sphingomonas caeni]
MRAARALAARINARQEESPFLPLGQMVRAAFLFYLFAYRILFPLMVALTSEGSQDLLAPRFIAEFYYTCLLAYPFIFYRKEYGWLHPLVLPVFWELGKALAKNPLTLVLPFQFPLVDFAVESQSKAASLQMSNIDLAWTRLQLSLVYCMSHSAYLAMFLFGPTFKVPRFKLYRPHNIAITSGAFILVAMGMASVFVISKGGVSELLVAMRGGRRELFEGYGQYVNAALLAPIIALAWFVYEKRPFTNPFFITGLVASLVTALIASGARSVIILSALNLILLWWKRRGRPLLLPTLVAALIGVIVVGAFGAIRQDYGSQTIDTSVLDPAQIGVTIQRAYEEIGYRDDEESALAVMAGANDKGLLWGKSYVNAAVFWVPRAIWDSKPDGIDKYNMWINFLDYPINSTPRDYGVWGIPVNGEMEAYWNFGLIGVVVVFGLLGTFNATLAKAAHVYQKVPIFWVIYIYTVLNLVGTSRSVIELLRAVAVLALFMLFAGIIRLRRGGEIELKPSAAGAAG